jgi:hypothetical protein
MENSNIIQSTQLQMKQIKCASYTNIIPKKDWTNIIDFLNYSEVKEVGKVNKYILIN